MGVMPRNAPAVKYRAVEGYGAQVTLCEPTITSRNETAAAACRPKPARIWFHPYDDDRIIAGRRPPPPRSCSKKSRIWMLFLRR